MNRSKKIIAILIALVLLLALSSCSLLADISKKMPSSENTYTSVAEVNRDMQDVLKNGGETFDYNIAGVTEDDLAHIADNMSTFWGEPREYAINSTFEDMEDIIPDLLVDVMSVTNTLRLSNNYYVYKYIRDGEEIPEDRARAREIAEALVAVKDEIFASSDGTDFGDVLSAHDWLVANLDYDESVAESGDENTSYGALVNRRTMCQGYAEALELILLCYTDVEVSQIVGEARNNPEHGGSGAWVGHAWNVVKIDGEWTHVDATFDDPQGNPAGAVSHFYFAQNDAVFFADHRWNDEYFPVCDGGDFTYYKKLGILAEDRATFEEMVTRALTESNPIRIEFAAMGVTLDQEGVQFMFTANKDIEEVYWSEQVYGDIYVHTIEPRYYNQE